MTRPFLQGADVLAVTEFVCDERVAEAVQFDVRHAGFLHGTLDLAKEVSVHLAIPVREEQPLGERQQFLQK